MSFVAGEMEREGFEIPLLIGGATTSRTHTAVKIEPHYHGPVIHVLDASRAVGVASALLDPGNRDAFAAKIRDEYETVRRERGDRQEKEARHPVAEARRHALAIDWTASQPPPAVVPGRADARGLPARRARRAHRLDAVLRDLGAARPLPGDPRRPEGRRGGARASTATRVAMLERIVDGAAAPRQRGVRVLAGEHASATTSSSTRTRRGPTSGPSSTPCASRWSSRPAGRTWRWRTSRRRRRPAWPTTSAASPSPPGTAWRSSSPGFEAAHDDYSAILAKALADRLAEAFAERLHERVRREFWGYAPDEALDNDALIPSSTRASGPAPGYPACPDHTEKGTLFELLECRGARPGSA